MITLIVSTLINLLRPLTKPFLPEMLYKLTFYFFASHIWLFLVGAFISEYFEQVIGSLKKWWWAALIISQIAMYTGFDFGTYGTIKSLFLGIGVIGLGYAVPKFSIKHDFSYGLYIYHMIVINVMVELGCQEKIMWLFVAYTVSFMVASTSYFTLGSLSRKLRKKAAGALNG